MYEKFTLTDFEDKNKWGLPGYFEVLCNQDANVMPLKETLNFNTIKLKLSFEGMSKDCDALFDDGKFKSLRFSFYNKFNGDMLWIFYADVKKENHLELSNVIYHYVRDGNGYISHFYPSVDKNLLNIYMRSKQPEGQDMRDLLPELDIIGVYDFNSVDFNQRLTLANMLVI